MSVQMNDAPDNPRVRGEMLLPGLVRKDDAALVYRGGDACIILVFLNHPKRPLLMSRSRRAPSESGRLRAEAAAFFGMMAGCGEFYTMDRKVGHIGQSVGRNDIRY